MPASNRIAEHQIHEQFTQRWSPRAFTDETIDKTTLLSFFEAARWAPSAYNSQPWRFLFALRGTPDFERYLSLLVEFNQGWAKHAAALVVIVSKTTFAAPGTTEEKPAPYPLKMDIDLRFTELLPYLQPGFEVLKRNRLKSRFINRRIMPRASTLRSR